MTTIDEAELTSTVADDPESRPGGIPLYVWVVAAAVLAVPVGLYWGDRGASAARHPADPDHPAHQGPGDPPGRPGDPQRDRHQRDPRAARGPG